jgi:ubiquinone/menaquinone biosynthesis C-methylase UbiE
MASKSLPMYSSNYERMSGNCTRLLAAQMIAKIDPPITSSWYILNNACGPGIVSEQIKLLHPDARILAVDIAPGIIEQAQQAINTNSWRNMETKVLDVRDLSALQDGTFTHVITNLGLPVPGDVGSGSKITKEMFRVLKKGGVALVSTWAGKTPSSLSRCSRC